MRRHAWIASLWLLGAAHARAAELPLELSWQAPSECPTEAELRAELERVARVREGVVLSALRAEVAVSRRGSTYGVTLRTEHTGQVGERRFEADNCKTLVRTLTLMLALAFGPGVELADDAAAGGTATGQRAAPPAEPQAASSTEAGERPPGAPTRATAAVPEVHAAAHHGLRWALILGGGAELGLLPSTAFAASLGVELGSDAWSVGLRPSALPGVDRALGAGLSAHFDALIVELEACGRLPFDALELALCGTFAGGALRGRARGSDADRSTAAPFYAFGAELALTWPRTGLFGARLSGELASALDRPRFVIDNFGPVRHTPALIGSFGAALVVRP